MIPHHEILQIAKEVVTDGLPLYRPTHFQITQLKGRYRIAFDIPDPDLLRFGTWVMSNTLMGRILAKQGASVRYPGGAYKIELFNYAGESISIEDPDTVGEGRNGANPYCHAHYWTAVHAPEFPLPQYSRYVDVLKKIK